MSAGPQREKSFSAPKVKCTHGVWISFLKDDMSAT